jgi:hypothetical protein
MNGEGRAAAVLAASILLVVPGATEAQLAPPGPPKDPASARFTLGDIWERLTTGAVGAKRVAGFVEPTTGTGTPSTKSTDDLMAAAPAADDTNGASAADVLTGRTFWGLRTRTGTWGPQAGTMPYRAGSTIIPGAEAKPILAGYHDGTGRVSGDSDLKSSNVRAGVSLFGVAGSVLRSSGTATAADVLEGRTFSNATGSGLAGTMPNRGGLTVIPGTSAQVIPAGYHDGSGSVAGDADLVAGNIRAGIELFGVAGTHPRAGVPKSGSTDCVRWDGALWVKDEGCATNWPPGQDGALQKGVAWPTPRLTDNGNGTVTDHLTGLVWLRNLNCWQYVNDWEEAFAAAAGLGEGDCGLTDGSAPGDWRLPNWRELRSLMNAFAESDPTPFTGPLVGSNAYWSSNTMESYWAVGVTLPFGSITSKLKDQQGPVWPVRGGLR